MGGGILKERSESDRVQQQYQRMNEYVYEAKIRLSKRTRKIEKRLIKECVVVVVIDFLARRKARQRTLDPSFIK